MMHAHHPVLKEGGLVRATPEIADALYAALETLLLAEKLDDDGPILIAAREQARAALAMARGA